MLNYKLDLIEYKSVLLITKLGTGVPRVHGVPELAIQHGQGDAGGVGGLCGHLLLHVRHESLPGLPGALRLPHAAGVRQEPHGLHAGE